MRRPLLTGLCVVWAAIILACTGAGGKRVELPGGQAIDRSDYRYYYSRGTNPGMSVDEHITDVGFDDRFILMRRDVRKCYWDSGPKYRRTEVIEFYILEISPPKRYGPFTEAEFGAARKQVGVPEGVVLEPTDKVRARVGPPRE